MPIPSSSIFDYDTILIKRRHDVYNHKLDIINYNYSSFLKSLINTIDNIDKDELGKGAKEIISNMRKDIGRELEYDREKTDIEMEVDKKRDEIKYKSKRRKTKMDGIKEKLEIRRVDLIDKLNKNTKDINKLKEKVEDFCNNPEIKC